MRARALRSSAVLAVLAPAWAHAFDGAYVEIPGGAWDMGNGPVPYVLDPAGSDDIAGDAELDALRAAFRAWECVEGVSLRFEEGAGLGPAAVDLEDNQNTLFWDETGEYGLGAATLGVTIGEAGGAARAQADIVFNGVDAQWSTDGSATDVGSIALHEIGHFVGLDHPCDRSPGGAESNCNGPERSVMTPVWGGAIERAPLDDDAEGVRALYPLGPDEVAGCDGPARLGERCSCTDDCADGLVCAGLPGEERVCAQPCATDDDTCGPDRRCVLDAADDKRARGVCIQIASGGASGGAPSGALCTTPSQCASGACTLIFDYAKSVCETSCDTTSDCGGGACVDGICLSPPLEEECPAPPAPGCGCGAARAPAGPWAGGGGMLGASALLLVVSRLIRTHRRRAGVRGMMTTATIPDDGDRGVPEARA